MNPIVFLVGAGVVVAGIFASTVAKAESAETSPMTVNRLPAGLRNRNPTNIKGRGWRGQTGSDPQGHAIFDTVVNGLRAAFLDLKTGFVRDNENTVRLILMEWAGAEAPSISNYIAFVAKNLGVSPDQKLSYVTHARAVVKAISEFELGVKAYAQWNPPNALFEEAFHAAG